MPAHKGVKPDTAAIDQLIKDSGLLIKQIVDPTRRKTLDRARQGQRVKDDFMHYLAQQLGVDVSDITIADDRPIEHRRFVSMKFLRTESLKGFPKGFFDVTEFESFDLLTPIEVEARFDVDDPSEEQAELAANLVDAVEALTRPQKPSTMIRAKGKLNSTIKKLMDSGIYLYIGSYQHRHSAMPFIDADQTEVAVPVVFERLLLIFAETRKSRAIHRKVDLGMSLDDMDQEVEWVNDLIAKSAEDSLDEDSERYLAKMREDAKNYFVDLSY